MTRLTSVSLALACAIAPPRARAQPPAPTEPAEPTEPTPVETAPLPAQPSEPQPAAPAPTAVPDEPTAADVQGAPRPGAESGRIVRPPPPESAGTWLGRRALIVPRAAFEIVVAPVRGGLWFFDRFEVEQRWRRWFFNDEGTFGVYPILALTSGYGVDVGLRAFHDDLFGQREQLSLRVGTGGRWSTILTGSVNTGDRLGDRALLEVQGRYERRPRERFFGIGDDEDSASPMTGTETKFREQVISVAGIGDFTLAEGLVLRASGAFADFDFAVAEDVDDPPPWLVYPEETMGTLGQGFRQAYGELELRWDTRGHVTRWEPPAVFASGWLMSAFAGYTEPLGEDGTTWEPYVRYGTDLQRFFRIGRGPRVLAARLYGEAVTAERDELPFTQLPVLGGRDLLRGYDLNRFRDRVAAMGSLEYIWDLSNVVSASLFVDAGRVYPSLDELTIDGMRVGYGIGLQAHTYRSFLVRAHLASSIDGDVFVNFSFDPVFEPIPRVERR